jgi:hypothetical protein
MFARCGIIDLLRELQFDKRKYKKLYETFKEYYDVIKGTPSINRETAGYLWTLHLFLNGVLNHYQEQTPNNNPELLADLFDAYNETLALVESIWFVN